jgi:RNA polymerase sigma-70 factor, ECF subfamily
MWSGRPELINRNPDQCEAEAAKPSDHPRARGPTAQTWLDPESRVWLEALRAEGAAREEAAHRLHALLFRIARFQLARRTGVSQLRGEEVDDVATEAADDALVRILGRLETFRGGSRFTTWACKFAILEASEALRKRLWKRRELPLADDWWRSLELSAADPVEDTEQLEVLHALPDAVEQVLTEQQREVFVAIALNGVPVDVIAVRRGSTCGAVYKALHDARRKLRARLGLRADAIITDATAERVREESPRPRSQSRARRHCRRCL